MLILRIYSKIGFQDYRDYYQRTALHKACKKGKLSIVKYLVNKGSDVNAVCLVS